MSAPTLTLDEIKRRLRKAYPCAPAAELDAMLAEATRHPEAAWVIAACDRLTEPQRLQLDGSEAQGYENGERVTTVEHPTDAPEAESHPESNADLLRIAIQTLVECPGGRRAFVQRLGALACLAGGVEQRLVADRIGVSEAALSRTMASVRQLLQGPKTGKRHNGNGSHAKVESGRL